MHENNDREIMESRGNTLQQLQMLKYNPYSEHENEAIDTASGQEVINNLFTKDELCYAMTLLVYM